LQNLQFQLRPYRRQWSQALFYVPSNTWNELEDVLLRTKFDRYQLADVRRAYLDFLDLAMESTSVHTTLAVCRDPKDDKFLELAIDGHADIIITGDKDLLALHPFHGIPIITPTAYLEL